MTTNKDTANPLLIRPLNILITQGTLDEKLSLAGSLLFMHPEDALPIVEALCYNITDIVAAADKKRGGVDLLGLDDFWFKLVDRQRAPQSESCGQAQQYFLEKIHAAGGDRALDRWFGSVRDGKQLLENYRALDQYWQGNGKRWHYLGQCLERNEILHLRRAIKTGNLDLIGLLIQRSSTPGGVDGGGGNFWMHTWATIGRDCSVELAGQSLDMMLKNGIDIDELNKYNYTALEWLASSASAGMKILGIGSGVGQRNSTSPGQNSLAMQWQ